MIGSKGDRGSKANDDLTHTETKKKKKKKTRHSAPTAVDPAKFTEVPRERREQERERAKKE